MSMVSEAYASYAEEVRKGWLAELKEAMASKDWAIVERLYKMMNDYRFTE